MGSPRGLGLEPLWSRGQRYALCVLKWHALVQYAHVPDILNLWSEPARFRREELRTKQISLLVGKSPEQPATVKHHLREVGQMSILPTLIRPFVRAADVILLHRLSLPRRRWQMARNSAHEISECCRELQTAAPFEPFEQMLDMLPSRERSEQWASSLNDGKGMLIGKMNQALVECLPVGVAGLALTLAGAVDGQGLDDDGQPVTLDDLPNLGPWLKTSLKYARRLARDDGRTDEDPHVPDLSDPHWPGSVDEQLREVRENLEGLAGMTALMAEDVVRLFDRAESWRPVREDPSQEVPRPPGH